MAGGTARQSRHHKAHKNTNTVAFDHIMHKSTLRFHSLHAVTVSATPLHQKTHDHKPSVGISSTLSWPPCNVQPAQEIEKTHRK
ncbi:hypothetical protein VTJ04DRAFT_9170 [Mycothermus thermophilus]|uniref:uncharacterized protein n=1 Tax=Humicola insolens TaxID=85995 RepID=UPI003742F4C0